MKLVFYEIYKLFQKRKMLFLCIILVVANIAVFFVLQQDKARFVSHNYYKEFQMLVEGIEDQEKLTKCINRIYDYATDYQYHYALVKKINTQEAVEEYHQYIRKKYGKEALQEVEKMNKDLTMDRSEAYVYYAGEWKKKIRYVKQYEEFRKRIEENKLNNVSIFNKYSTYAFENVKKTKADFKKLGKVEISIGNQYTIRDFLTYSYTPIFLIGIAFLLAVGLIRTEQDVGLFMLVKSQKNGKTSLIAAKVLAYFGSLLFFTFIMEGSLLGTITYVYGDVDWTMSIQSISNFRNCCLPLQAWEFVLLCVLTRFFSVFLVGMFFILLLLLFQKNWFIYLSAGVVLFSSLLLYLNIFSNSKIAFLKYGNIIQGLLPSGLYGTYQNIAIGKQPVNVSIIFLIVTLLVFGTLGILINKTWKDGEYVIGEFYKKKKQSKIRGKISITKSLFHMYFIQEKKVILCFGMLLFGIYMACFRSVITLPVSLTQTNYEEQVKGLQGPLTEKTKKAIKKKEKYYISLIERSKELANKEVLSEDEKIEVTALDTQIGLPYDAFLELKEQFEMVKERKMQGKDAQLLNVYSWNRLFDNATNEVKNLMLAGVFCVFLCGSIFENKKNMNKLVATTKYGRRSLWRRRYLQGIGCAVLSWVSFVLPELIRFIRTHPGNYWGASIGNLLIFRNVELECSIGTMTALIYFGELVLCILMALSIMFLVDRTENTFMSMTIIMAGILGIGTIFLKQKKGIFCSFATDNINPIKKIIVVLVICIILSLLMIIFWEREMAYKRGGRYERK